jgi:hypothetical protein
LILEKSDRMDYSDPLDASVAFHVSPLFCDDEEV